MTAFTLQGKRLHNEFGKFTLIPVMTFYRQKVIPALTYGAEAGFNIDNRIWAVLELFVSIVAIRHELGLDPLDGLILWKSIVLLRKMNLNIVAPAYEILKEMEATYYSGMIHIWAMKIRKSLAAMDIAWETHEDDNPTPGYVQMSRTETKKKQCPSSETRNAVTRVQAKIQEVRRIRSDVQDGDQEEAMSELGDTDRRDSSTGENPGSSKLYTKVQGTVDNHGTCQCSVYLPDNTFPIVRLEELEMTIHILSIRAEQELSTIEGYTRSIEIYEHKIRNLSLKVEIMEKTSVSYSELDFEILKIELAEIERVIIQLKFTVGNGNQLIDQLHVEIKNISVTLHGLERYDKNNLLAIRREILNLQNKVKECEESSDKDSPFTVPPGSCAHAGISNISQPVAVQRNWLGLTYKFGGWGKSYFASEPGEQLYWVAPMYDRYFRSYRVFKSYGDLLLQKVYKEYAVPVLGDGAGGAMYGKFLYYNVAGTRDIAKLDVTTNRVVLRKTLPDAAFNNRFPYVGVQFQDLDVAVDESGLWVIGSTEASDGKLVLSKLNESTLDVESTWQTSQYKPSVTSAFMVCGVLYALRPIDTRQEEIFYTYDTHTGKEGRISILVNKMSETIQSINYNPEDHNIYVLNDGYLTLYHTIFLKER
ncbi:olfactomedin-4 [Ambystoma mexicanum]|uniref:olfactomedin-4 n=1 Tax=Ambystoma mexicanum TaxID=8296 RepID=UPI0037E80D95